MKESLSGTAEAAVEQIETYPGERVIRKVEEIASSKYGLHFKDWVIVGLRGFTYDKKKGFIANSDAIDEFNDTLILLRTGKKGLEFECHRCTMDPGWYWIRAPMVPGGAARLEPGLYIYQKGLHRGNKAFTQFQKVAVRRDRNLDGIWTEAEPVQHGFFGINIHASYTKDVVGVSSAGCTVIAGGWSSKIWKRFRDTLYNSGQLRFPYLVLSDKERKEVVKVV